MEPTKEQFYLRRIAELEKQVAELLDQVAKLTEQVARLSKNSSNSSKPPSSDIVKPPKPKNPKGPRRQGGQPGHRGVNRPPFRPDQINRVVAHGGNRFFSSLISSRDDISAAPGRHRTRTRPGGIFRSFRCSTAMRSKTGVR